MAAASLDPATRFAIVRATFYEEIAQRLTDGALRAFGENGVREERVDVHDVPGAFELAFAARECALSDLYAGVVCLGAVIRGETDHYDYVCQGATYGIQHVQLETGIPCGFGLLTVERVDQALTRSGGDKRDQGYNAALTVLRMVELAAAIREA